MKRLLPVILIAVLAATAWWFRGNWLPGPARQDVFLGYVEADTSLIAAPVAGRLVRAPPEKGASVKRGDVLFALDDAAALAEVARLKAALAVKRATLANLETGKRPPEVAQIEEQLAQAKAAADLARLDLERVAKTMAGGSTSFAQFDKAKAAVTMAEAQTRQLEAAVLAARLPARADEITAARAGIEEAEAALKAAEIHAADFTIAAPRDGLIENTFFAAGETVAAGQPVVELREAGAGKLIFFIPQAELARARPGGALAYACDGCAPGTATITHVEAAPEFTPPVIYSESAKAKLVFRAEARVGGGAEPLVPGLPVTVSFAP